MTRRLHAVVPQAAGAASCGGREPLRPGERGQLDAGGGTVIEASVGRDQSARSPQTVRDDSDSADVLLAQPWTANGAARCGARVGVALTTLPVFALVDADAQAPSFAGGTR